MDPNKDLDDCFLVLQMCGIDKASKDARAKKVKANTGTTEDSNNSELIGKVEKGLGTKRGSRTVIRMTMTKETQYYWTRRPTKLSLPTRNKYRSKVPILLVLDVFTFS